jgi:hypothetical protein
MNLTFRQELKCCLVPNPGLGQILDKTKMSDLPKVLDLLQLFLITTIQGLDRDKIENDISFDFLGLKIVGTKVQRFTVYVIMYKIQNNVISEK